MYKKIIVPLDGSKLAECVLPHVESIAKAFNVEEVILAMVTEHAPGLVSTTEHIEHHDGFEVHQPSVVFVDRPYSGRQLGLDPSLKIPLVTGKMLKQGQRYLGKVAEQMVKSGVKAGIAVLTGEPAEQIIDFAGMEGADLIVMASHGRSGLSRWAMGSVAEKVFRGSSIPILLVKALPEDAGKL